MVPTDSRVVKGCPSLARVNVGGDALLDACLERISGCKFVSVDHLGTRRETWVFQTPDGVRLPVFGSEAIVAIAYGVAG